MHLSKKIIITVSNDVLYDQRITRIALSLHKAGYDITILGRKNTNIHNFADIPYKVILLSNPFKRGFLLFAWMNIRFFFYLLMHPCPIVCAVDLDTILPSIFIKKIRKITLVYDAHELYPESPEIIHRKLVKKIWIAIEKITFKNIDICYTVSQGIADFFYKKYHFHCSLIRNMPEFRNVEGAEKINERYLLYQGALNIGRGLESLILAMVYIKGIPLYIAGGGDIEDELKKLVKDNNLGDKIKFLGKLSPSKLHHLTRHAYIGFNLLENRGLSYYYSLANKFFDYIQCGIPQLCMDFPEYKNMNSEYEVAILVSDLDPLALSQQILYLLDDSDTYLALQTNSLKAAKQWNWNKESQKLLAIYGNI